VNTTFACLRRFHRKLRAEVIRLEYEPLNSFVSAMVQSIPVLLLALALRLPARSMKAMAATALVPLSALQIDLSISER
jgi:hypothetical protein